MKYLYANNASTTLQSGVTSSATSILLATGTGSLFPEPADASQGFWMTLLDAETQQSREIVFCTARSSDVCTVIRGQQGTTAAAWSAGDLASQLFTMSDADNMVQPDEQLANAYLKPTAVGGSANGITATFDTGLLALTDMMSFVIPATAANTGAATLTLTLGAGPVAAKPIQKFGGAALVAGDIPEAGYPIQLTYSNALGAFIMANPAFGQVGSIAGGAANEVLVQTGVGNTGFVPAPTIAGQVLGFFGGVISWAIAAVTSFNGRGGAVMPQTGDYNAGQVGAVALSAFTAPNVSEANPGFVALPSANPSLPSIIIQAGSGAISPNTATAVAFGKVFPNRCVSVVCSCNNQGAALEVDGFTPSSFNVRVNANFISWVAFGY